MKVADVKIVKAIKEFLSEIAPGYSKFEFSTEDVLKSKNQEKGSLYFSITVPPDGFPDILDEDKKSVKKILQKYLKKNIRYLRTYWAYSADKEVCSISFDVKLS